MVISRKFSEGIFAQDGAKKKAASAACGADDSNRVTGAADAFGFGSSDSEERDARFGGVVGVRGARKESTLRTFPLETKSWKKEDRAVTADETRPNAVVTDNAVAAQHCGCDPNPACLTYDVSPENKEELWTQS